MDIFYEAPDRLRVVLDKSDLDGLGITYDELDYGSEKTRDAIDLLLGKVGAGGPGDEERMIIEAFPADGGGCVIYFTSLPKRAARLVRRKNGDVGVFEFSAADDMMRALGEMSKRGSRADCALYEIEGRYRVVVPDLRDGERLLLGEFGAVRHAKNAAAYTAEHGRLLTSDALAVASKFFI